MAKHVGKFEALMLLLFLCSCSGGGQNPGGTKDESWSSNFTGVTDLAASGISSFANQLALDTSNVNSGGQSIKSSGDIGQGLDVDFSISSLVGKDTIDFSTKTLSVEVYVPADSPASRINIHLFNGASWVEGRTAHTRKGQWSTYDVDFRDEVDLHSWYGTSDDLSDDDAVGVIKNTRMIRIMGCPGSTNDTGSAYFLIDKLSWDASGAAISYDPTKDSLCTLAQAKSLPVGGLIETEGYSDPTYMRTLVQNFDLTLWGGTWPDTEPAGDVFSPSPTVDATLVDRVALKYGFSVIRYAGTQWMTDWVKSKSYNDAKTILTNYVSAYAGAYGGKTLIWLLFNEALRYDLESVGVTGLGLKDRNQDPQTVENNYSPWASSPSDVSMIEAAFGAAKAADPTALLFFNDSVVGPKSRDAMYNLAVTMKNDGEPIDGVGMEWHLLMDQSGSFHQAGTQFPAMTFGSVSGFTDIDTDVKRYAAASLKVAFTEVDVSVYTADIDSTAAGQQLLAQRLALQAAAYKSLIHIALTNPNVVAFNFWDWTRPVSVDRLQPEPIPDRLWPSGTFRCRLSEEARLRFGPGGAARFLDDTGGAKRGRV